MSEPVVRHSVVINESPRPRLLILGFDDQETELVEQLSALVPTSRVIAHLGEVRQAEWDVLVARQGIGNAAEAHISMVFIAPQGDDVHEVYEIANLRWDWEIMLYRNHISTELLRYKGLPTRIEALVHQQLEPLLRTRQRQEHFVSRNSEMGKALAISVPKRTLLPPPDIEPFIASADEKILAGRYRRSPTSEAWLLPSDTPDVVSWVRAALAEWHGLAPDRFPGVPDWSETEPWLTDSERKFEGALREVEAERTLALARLAQRESELNDGLIAAREDANQYERALLTAQGDSLEYAVLRALEELGFQVVDADLEAEKRRNLHDLVVTDPSAPGWVALGEIKGFTKGASTSGISQFIRFTALYAKKHGRLPDATWYIVNQFIGQDPSTRQRVLQGMKDDVESFAEGGGLLLDTVALFRSLMMVRDGRLAAEKARAQLRQSAGRFELGDEMPPPEPQA